MTTPRKWQKTSAYAWRCDPWSVSQVRLNGAESFELWHDKRPGIVGRYPSRGEAFAAAKDAEERGEG